MFDTLVNRGLMASALAAAVLAFGLWRDGKAKADRITDLEGQVAEQRADAAALRTLAERRPQVEIRYRDGLAAVNAAGERTSDACLSDPRIAAAYRALGLHDDAPGDAARGTERRLP